MASVGINVERALGVSMPDLRALARHHRRDHDLALALWGSGIHEARILASLVDDPSLVTERQMEDWAADFDSWDLCDQVCSNLFEATPFAMRKARAWSRRDQEFVVRAGFTLIATRASRDRASPDIVFERMLPLIRRGAADDRNHVRKAVSWALRAIGKRNLALHAAAVAEAEGLIELGGRSARWIGRDALRDLERPSVKARIAARA
jgi:3-methyladenine DNA glycosylase AlkD